MSVRADLLVTGARPWSGGAPVAGADAIAVGGGRVLALGPAAELEPLAHAGTERLDAGGATVTPGLCDAHLHLLAWARSLDEVALGGAATRAEALARVAALVAASPGHGSLVGRGWDANAWAEAPDRASLDAVTGDRPALLHSKDYHALWANSAALRAAGVERGTPDPEGGRFERDAAGEPTGLVRERAVRRFAALEEAAPRGSDLDALERAIRRLHALGVTMVHDVEGLDAIRALRALSRDPARPPLRVVAHLPQGALDAAIELGLTSGAGDDRFRYGALKLFADGALGSRTAALLEPYEGTSDRGMELVPRDELARLVARAAAAGITVAIHAIGDRAVRAALDAIEPSAPVLAALLLPPRLEHVQLLHPDDRPRFARLGVWASLQPSHCVADIDIARAGWGSRAGLSYPWRTLLDAGAPLAFGSDAPVEPPVPALGLHAAVTRQRVDGTPEGGFVPGERLTLDEALLAYTRGGAALAGRRGALGRIAPGLPADLVVWDRDLHAAPACLLHEVAPTCTLVAGRIVHRGTAHASPSTPSRRSP
jgi:predicted amidohydrolase YtcJ